MLCARLVGAVRAHRQAHWQAGHGFLGLPTSNWIAKLRSPARASPQPGSLGSERLESPPSRRWGARRTRMVRSAGARCETRRHRTSAACVRQAATLPEGGRHVMEKAQALGVHCASRGGGRVHYVCGRATRVVHHSVVRVVHFFFAAGVSCVARTVQVGGGGKCAPCRRGSRPVPASAKTWPMGGLGGGGGAVGGAECGIGAAVGFGDAP